MILPRSGAEIGGGEVVPVADAASLPPLLLINHPPRVYILAAWLRFLSSRLHALAAGAATRGRYSVVRIAYAICLGLIT